MRSPCLRNSLELLLVCLAFSSFSHNCSFLKDYPIIRLFSRGRGPIDSVIRVNLSINRASGVIRYIPLQFLAFHLTRITIESPPFPTNLQWHRRYPPGGPGVEDVSSLHWDSSVLQLYHEHDDPHHANRHREFQIPCNLFPRRAWIVNSPLAPPQPDSLFSTCWQEGFSVANYGSAQGNIIDACAVTTGRGEQRTSCSCGG